MGALSRASFLLGVAVSLPAGLQMAIEASRPAQDTLRRHRVGSVALRRDGTFVRARNGSSAQKERSAHAEYRVLRKAGLYSILYVARVKRDGSCGLALPCNACMMAIMRARVTLVYFTTGEGATAWATLEL